MKKINTILTVFGIVSTALLLGMLIGYFSQKDCPDLDCNRLPTPCIDVCPIYNCTPCICDEIDCVEEIVTEITKAEDNKRILKELI